MRYFLPILLVLAAAWYFTTGVRLGMVTFTPTQMFNANGESTYNIRAFEDYHQVGMTGSCDVKSGEADIRLYAPGGSQVAGQACQKGKWSINISGRGSTGFYRVVVNYHSFSGRIELNEFVSTKR